MKLAIIPILLLVVAQSLCCGPAITTFEAGLSPSKFLHVTPSGSSAGDGSLGNPFDIPTAVAHATPGTSVVIHAGTYSGNNYLNSIYGTAAAPIWIGGAPGEALPVLGGTAASSEVIKISLLSYVIIHDIIAENSNDNGINIDDNGNVTNPLASHHLIIRNITIQQIGLSLDTYGGNSDCLKLSGVSDFWVIGNTINGCGGVEGSGVDCCG
jgi:hypothetical protein